MSRIGNRKLIIPDGVTVTLEGNLVTVKGLKGELSTTLDKDITMKLEDKTISLTRNNELLETRAKHGTMNANINNMINGVKHGYKKELEIVGVGYRFNLRGDKLVISAGYSHPVEVMIPKDIKIEVPSNTELTISGIDKVLVGEFAAQIREIRRPEPYKGKGIRYKDEYIRRKEGKKAA